MNRRNERVIPVWLQVWTGIGATVVAAFWVTVAAIMATHLWG